MVNWGFKHLFIMSPVVNFPIPSSSKSYQKIWIIAVYPQTNITFALLWFFNTSNDELKTKLNESEDEFYVLSLTDVPFPLIWQRLEKPIAPGGQTPRMKVKTSSFIFSLWSEDAGAPADVLWRLLVVFAQRRHPVGPGAGWVWCQNSHCAWVKVSQLPVDVACSRRFDDLQQTVASQTVFRRDQQQQCDSDDESFVITSVSGQCGCCKQSVV